jgi:hypothetical protein
MRFLGQCLVALVLSVVLAQAASAQVFFSNTRVGSVVQTHATIGTTAAVAIASASVSPNLLAWSICNDAVNTSTYLYVGKATDPTTDGTQLAPGACYACPNCLPATLKAVKIVGQAAANGYSVIQYKQQ